LVNKQSIFKEKCLVVHSYPTSIPPLSIWTNNVGDSGESVVGPNFLNNIIGPNRQGWDRSGIRVYNQAFLIFKTYHHENDQLNLGSVEDIPN
jgi:hypothetical protein